MVNMLIKTIVLKRVLIRYFAEDKTWTMKSRIIKKILYISKYSIISGDFNNREDEESVVA